MQRYFASEKNGVFFELKPEDIYHIKTVMRMKDFDEIEVVYEQTLYLCCIEDVKKNIKIRMKEMLVQAKERMPEVILCIPLLKEQKMDYILQKATELGVSKIVFLELSRSIIKVDREKFQKKKVRWEKICKEASEQSMRHTIPEIGEQIRIPDLESMDGLKVVCSTREQKKTLKNLLQTPDEYDKLVIVIGPEGGLALEEENKLVEVGFVPVSLGHRILRVETAPLYVLSILNYIYME